jgi:glutamate/tyrosine decarboxylase-like PLP-dependent enzyme
MRTPFPERGLAKAEVIEAISAMKAGDADWRNGRVPLFVFKADDEVDAVARAAFNELFTENALGRMRAFPSLKRMEDEIVGMALDLFQAPAEARGYMTTGGTESIIMAAQAARDHARAKRGERRHRGNIVGAVSMHPAFDKAARMMDLEVRRLPVAADLRADSMALAAAVDGDTIVLVGSAPCFPYGVIDPIEELAELARACGVWLHVDACVGGYLAPFAKAAGYPIPAFDFSVPGVNSLSADLHKFGYTPKPASTVLYRSAELARHHGFDFDGWPNGRFATTTIVGTRPGGAVAGAWGVMRFLGREGYTRLAAELMTFVMAYKEGVAAIPGLHVLGEPHLSIVAVGSDSIDPFRIAELMQAKGWVPGLVQSPKALHRMMSLLHAPALGDYLGDLRAAAEAAAREGSVAADIKARY